MTTIQKAKIKSLLKKKYATRWANVVAQRAGYTPHYVRWYFRSKLTQPTIEEAAIDMVRVVKHEQKIVAELLN